MPGTLAEIWNGWWQKTAEQQISKTLASDQVDRRDDYVEIVQGKHYVRVWLAEMFIHDQVKIFQSWYPAVHSRVNITFDGQTHDICNIADSSKVGMQQDHKRGDVIARNFPLTPLLPFNAGVIELDMGLVAIEGQNYINQFIKVLGDFSSLLAVPQLSSALKLATPLANGLQAIFGAGSLHLGIRNAFGPKNTGGYFVAIRSTEAQVRSSQLYVVDNRLRIGNGPGETESEPFASFDYMLFRIEVCEERDDYDMLPAIQDPMRKAQEALLSRKLGAPETEADMEAETYLRAAIVAAYQAPEFTRADRSRVTRKLKDDFNQIREDLDVSNLVGEEDGLYNLKRSLQNGAWTPQSALDRGMPSFEELLSN